MIDITGSPAIDRALGAFLEQIPAGISVAEIPSGRLLYHNDYAVRLLRHPLLASADIRGYAQYGAMHLDGRPYRPEEYPIARAVTNDEVIHDEVMRYRRGDGTFSYYRVSANRFSWDDRAPLAISFFVDVGDLKAAEGTLAETVATLQDENLLRDRFVSTLSHDLRNALAVALLSVDQVKRVAGDAVTRPLERARNALFRAQNMIQDMLDVNRLKTGQRPPVNLQHVEIASLARSAIDDLTVMHGRRFRYDGPDELTAIADPSALRRILENLLDNAAKYGEPATEIDLRLSTDDECVVLRVSNQGRPIESRRDLFAPFRRGRGEQRPGWGLGLYLVRGLTDSLGGSIKHEAIAGGNAFVVKFPLEGPR